MAVSFIGGENNRMWCWLLLFHYEIQFW